MDASAESQADLIYALRALEMQLAEGIDEVILAEPVNRFDNVPPSAETPATASPLAAPVPQDAPAETSPAILPDFESCKSAEEICAALASQLPRGLVRNTDFALEILGDETAEIAIVIDPPRADAERAQDLGAEPAIELLRRSLAAIDLATSLHNGKEPRARIALLPVSPWRIAQDRKLIDHDATLFARALKARLALRNFKAVLFAGSNLARLDQEIKDGQFEGLASRALVAPSLMLREPLLKQKHWDLLREFHASLDEVLKL